MIQDIKKQFPFLSQEKNGQPLVYFDNACMTPCPLPVLEAVDKYNREFFSCGGRSNTHFGRQIDNKVAETRELVAKFIGAGTPQEIIFTKNTTEGINLVARGLNLQAGERVLVSDREHNSDLIVWQVLQKERGIELVILPSKSDETFDLAGLETELQKGIKLVSVVYSSNLDGYTLPVEEIVKMARKYDALVMLDGAQAVPHHAVNVKKLGVDFLAFSGHKMMAPSGTGVLYGRLARLEKLSPLLSGGHSVKDSHYDNYEAEDIPARFEAGLQNYGGIIGLGEAIKFIKQVGFDFIVKQEFELNYFITRELKQIGGISFVGADDPKSRGGIVNFYHEKMDSHQLSIFLDESANILTRSGRHCVHSWYNSRGVKDSIRVSSYFYNTIDEAEKLISALKKILGLV
ncbi:MAG TPA: cysteine desulfurase [Candidatus Magasanikbacteria bacterium]|uniref:Aminotransferase class V domain-containing protein n=2 Tax=Candidatus Magasanikiibacteriota TaxID=1752731 RepID=A0A0G0WIT4_9BACT|nr:MAG: hypothetical protein UU49_C0032G0011 [Candidatus Magasanikbacteria bacterium GW2011_GWC2_41_17]KKS12780.1 MAG: hypothetical protein UU69_C0023G0006 [Candidatus Magasanikbacteria bacterium GW2011_GWA2_41_55]HBV57906.1 cysteine desulfurase [Candidatus Magasanikbacteria bacterium]HBX15807.1 cysteine desulfurase [Candidatus Magasanikbacteria bacterium]